MINLKKTLGIIAIGITLGSVPSLAFSRSTSLTITAVVATINALSINGTPATDFGTVNLDPARVYIDGTGPGTTATPNALADGTKDPWLLKDPLKIALVFKNNLPGDLFIYTKHDSESYFSKVSQSDLSPTTNLSGLLRVGGVSGDGPALVTSANTYLATIPIRSWADRYFEGKVTTSPTADWVWITDASPSYNSLANDPAKVAKNKQKLIPYSLAAYDSAKPLDVYIRGAFSWPKYAGLFKGNLYIEFVQQ